MLRRYALLCGTMLGSDGLLGRDRLLGRNKLLGRDRFFSSDRLLSRDRLLDSRMLCRLMLDRLMRDCGMFRRCVFLRADHV